MSTDYWKNKHGHYVLDGVHYVEDYTPVGRVKAVGEYDDIRQDDVIIAGFPKTGNHFVADIVKKLRNKGDICKSVKEACDVFLEAVVPDIAQYNKDARFPMSLEDISAIKSPRVMNTHLYYEKLPKKAQAGYCKIIHILRDPRDAVCSWLSMEALAQQEMRRRDMKMSEDSSFLFHNYIKEFINGTVMYGSWYDHTKGYLNARPAPHVLLVKYEDIVKNMEEEIKKIAKFIGEDLSDDTLATVAEACRIENVKKAFPTSIFLNKGNVGTWREHLTVADNEAMKAKMLEKLNGFHSEIQMYLS